MRRAKSTEFFLALYGARNVTEIHDLSGVDEVCRRSCCGADAEVVEEEIEGTIDGGVQVIELAATVVGKDGIVSEWCEPVRMRQRVRLDGRSRVRRPFRGDPWSGAPGALRRGGYHVQGGCASGQRPQRS